MAGASADDLGPGSGAVYVFERTGTIWTQEAKLTASDGSGGDHFGDSVSLLGDTALVGTPYDNDMGSNSGSCYVLEYIFEATCTWYCGTGANAATDGYDIVAPATIGGDFVGSVTRCNPGNVGAILVAYSASGSYPTPWGELLVDFTDPNGELFGTPSGYGDPVIIQVTVPNDMQLCGFVFYTQAASFGGGICLHCAYECAIGI